MTFLSYAQNFEDVMLWRALRYVDRGFYIDVGAAHPDIDSVTRAFYDRGWSGINIEPVASSAARLAAARARDITLRAAVGEASGTADFFVVAGTGLSTMERGALPAIAQAGFAAEPTVVEMITLADICRKHAPADIHFLKIDVEGAEEAVLKGADFSRFRPWIVLAEATAPMSTRDTSDAWEPLFLQAGYQFVYFDGLNRFYVADEHYDALAPNFATPPNVFDDFLRVADTDLARRLGDAQTRIAEIESLEREVARTRDLARVRGEENDRLTQLLLSLLTEHAASLQEARDANDWLQAMRRSTSWRMTSPLRLLVSTLQTVRRRASSTPSAPQIAPAAPATIAPTTDHSATALEATPEAAARVPLRLAAHAPLLRSVHQFHSGSAVGDAVTNSMLLTRTLLRRQGYVSEIFVEHLDPLLADELRPMDELPIHADYVLIVLHSMGYEAFDRIAALPAPKVLIYHNITPPSLFPDAPDVQHYLRLGREQLVRWRSLVSGTLAVSDFNAIELRRLGFADVLVSTLLFDVAALRARGATRSAANRTGAFTILFVGRVVPSKGQDDLVAAFAEFLREFDGPSRLVLVGRHDGPGAAYFDTLSTHVQAADLQAHVTITGFVSDSELHAWYSAADLYVSVSRHEGFGVPLVEAMAYDIPVLALPAGAIPYTLDGTGELLSDAEPTTVAAAILALARDPTRRIRMAERQRRSLDRFALDRQLRPLSQALAQAGAGHPDDGPTRDLLGANMSFTVTGHVNKTYSLAAINRTLALTIESQRPGRVRLRPVEGQPTADLSQVPESMRTDLTRLVERADPDTGPDVVISQHYPVFVPPTTSDVAVALFFWEESRVPTATIDVLNSSFRGVLAPSRSVAKALIDSGLSIPVHHIGYPPALDAFSQIRPARVGDRETFVFLHVSSGFPRKGVDVLLAAFARAFSATDPVRLVIKVFPNPHNDIAAQIDRLRIRTPALGEIVLIDRDISERELLDLYGNADTVVLPTRGEGFNLPAAEAMAAGIPVIVTGFGGQMDFCTPENVRLLAFRFAQSASHVATPHSIWIEPDEDDLVAALQDAVRNPSAGIARAATAGKTVAKLRDRAGFVRQLTEIGVSLLLTPPLAQVRIGWVSTWQVRCGVAGYSEALLSAMPVGSAFTMFCDTRTAPEQPESDGMPVQRVWRLGDPDSLPGLATAIAAADPQILVVQHQPALIAWGALGQFLNARSVSGRIVVVTLHNTRHLLDIPDGERKTALTALAGIARVIVHTVADLNFLKDLGLLDNVTVMPHGAPPRAAAVPVRQLTPEDEPIIGCYGFFLPGKGIGALIEAVAILRRQWPRARLKLVNADYGTPESADEIAACRTLAQDLDVPIEWCLDFLPSETSLALLRTCDVVALPYQASIEAASGALHTALSAGGVMAVTDLELFQDAGDAVFRFSGRDPANIAQGLARLLGDQALRIRTQEAASVWLAARQWDVTAGRLHGMLIGLTRSE